MFKRLIAGSLLVLASVTVFAGCESKPTTSVETRTPEEIAAENAAYEAEMDVPDEGE